MSYLRRRKINGKHYIYLVKSVRMPDGKNKKIMKMLKDAEKKDSVKKLEKKYRNYLIEKEAVLNYKYTIRKFKSSYIFSEDEIRKLEKIKVKYKNLFRKLKKEQKKDIFDRFAINFTYNSNAIEGNSLTLKDVRIVIFNKSVIKGKDLREIYETRNSRRVTDMVLRKKFKISHKDIKKMHRMLMKDIDSRIGYKQLPNVIITMGREIKTTLPEKVQKEMNILIKWYNSNEKKIHPLELATLFHGKFEKIHPFEDGNGRVGRFLVNSILINNGYPPIIIRKTVRGSYINSLRAFDLGHDDKLKRFMISKFKETFSKFFEVYAKYV